MRRDDGQGFFSYSHEDEALRDQLEKHLASLKHEGTIDAWYDRRILPGDNIDAAIDAQIDSAEVVLLLVSASFLSSHYCYSIEMQRALARHAKGECKVVPVILRACDWSHSPLGKLLAVPKDGKPITSWTNPDEAYTDVVRQIRALLKEVSSQSGTSTSQPLIASASLTVGASVLTASPARSSNLRLRKEFTDFDKDQFAHDSFDYVRRFFENSLSELQASNAGIQDTQRSVSESRFTASIYRDGRVMSECAIAIGADFGRNSITYASQISSNGYNEILSVESDDQQMFFTALMGMHGGTKAKLGPEGVAELLWENLLQRLQR